MRFRRAAYRSIRSILPFRVSGIRNHLLIRQRIIVSRLLRQDRLFTIQGFAQRRRMDRFLGTRALLTRRNVDGIVRVMSTVRRLTQGDLRSLINAFVTRRVAGLYRSRRRAHAVFIARPPLCVMFHRRFVISTTYLLNALKGFMGCVFFLRGLLFLSVGGAPAEGSSSCCDGRVVFYPGSFIPGT